METNEPQARSDRIAARRERLLRDLVAGRTSAQDALDRLDRLTEAEKPWQRGADGTRHVAARLDLLLDEGWTVLHDVRRPGAGHGTIDHLLVGPGGVVVVDTRAWTGRVVVAATGLRQNGYRRDRLLVELLETSALVTALVAPQARTSVRAVMCLVGHDVPPSVLGGVAVVDAERLVAHVRALPVRLSAHEATVVAGELSDLLTVSRPARTVTTAAFTRPGVPRQGWGPAGALLTTIEITPRTRRRVAGGVLRVLLTAGLLLGLAQLAPDPGAARPASTPGTTSSTTAPSQATPGSAADGGRG